MNDSSQQYVTDANGNRVAVLLPIEQYEQMIEDLHDLAIVAQRRQEEPISLEKMRQRLGVDQSV
jgi:PHD/YefM family antitoxin component YafN of YafNO toxin-antitoxin module